MVFDGRILTGKIVPKEEGREEKAQRSGIEIVLRKIRTSRHSNPRPSDLEAGALPPSQLDLIQVSMYSYSGVENPQITPERKSHTLEFERNNCQFGNEGLFCISMEHREEVARVF